MPQLRIGRELRGGALGWGAGLAGRYIGAGLVCQRARQKAARDRGRGSAREKQEGSVVAKQR